MRRSKETTMTTPITRDYSWTRQPKTVLSKKQRGWLTDILTERINEAMLESETMRLEAILEGRVGLNEMSDQELIDFAQDCWDITL